jgi:hypothetical protein
MNCAFWDEYGRIQKEFPERIDSGRDCGYNKVRKSKNDFAKTLTGEVYP